MDSNDLPRGFNRFDAKWTIIRYQRRFATALDFSCMTDDVISELKEQTGKDIVKGCGDTLSKFLALHLLNPPSSEIVPDLEKASNISRWITSSQSEWVLSRSRGIEPPNISVSTHPLTALGYSLLAWGLLADSWMRKQKKKLLLDYNRVVPQFPFRTLRGRIELHGDYILVGDSSLKDKLICYPSIILSMIISKTTELGVFLHYITHSNRSDRIYFLRQIQSFLNSMSDVMLYYGNRGYKVFKALDGICQGIVIIRGDESHNSFLLDNILDNLRNENLLDSPVKSLIRVLENVPIGDVMNFSGLSKSFGHPVINTDEGLQKLYDRTHKPIDVAEENIVNVINMATFSFCIEYHKKHKRYPLLEIGPGVPGSTLRSLMRNVPLKGARASDFRNVRICRCFPFDEYERLYPLIKDKTVSKSRSIVECALLSKGRMYSLSSRALIDFLRNPSTDIEWKSYMKRFARSPNLCAEDFVIKLTFKELELKDEGRLFGSSTLCERNRRVAMESNVCLLMDKYLPDQAMTLTDNEKRQKIYSLSLGRLIKPDCEQFVVSVDAEAWNNYFRSPVVDTFGREFLDRIFGTTYFCSTMKVFNQALIYNITTGRHAKWWKGQDGGIEGLAQKVWTWVYCSIARLVIEEIGAEGHLLVNGDDMRMILYVDRQRVLQHDDFHGYLLGELRRAFDAYGIKMKIDETAVTKNFISFSRQAMLNGVNLPSDWKKILKCSGMSDVELPLIGSIVPNIFSNAHSAAGLGYSSLSALNTAIFMTAAYLLVNSPEFKDSLRADFHNTVLTLTTPGILNGLEVILLPTIMQQGESDPLPAVLDWYRFLLEKRRGFLPGIRRILSIEPRRLTETFAGLISNPYALPCRRSFNPIVKIRNLIRKRLPSFTRNQAICELLSFDSKYRDDLISNLATMDPFYARVASFLYGLTPCALVDSIVSKFENSASVSEVIIHQRRSRMTKFFNKIFYMDEQYILDRVRTSRLTENIIGIESSRALAEGTCASTVAQAMRVRLWQHPNMWNETQPLAFMQVVMVLKSEITATIELNTFAENHFVVQTAPANQTDCLEGLVAVPPWKPHFENVTSVNLSERFSLNGRYEPLVESISKVTEAMAQLYGIGGSIIEWLDIASISLFGEPITEFIPTATVKLSGTLAHRLRSRRFCETVYLNLLPARSSRCRMNIDANKTTNAMGAKNKFYNFGAFRNWMIWSSTTHFENDLTSIGDQNTFWGCLQNCGRLCSCHRDLEEPELTLQPPPRSFSGHQLRIMRCNWLLKLSDSALSDIAAYREDFAEKWFSGGIVEGRLTYAEEELNQCAIIHLLKELDQQEFRLIEGNLRDIVMINRATGVRPPLHRISCKDLCLIDTTLLLKEVFRDTYYTALTVAQNGGLPTTVALSSTPTAFLMALAYHIWTVRYTRYLLRAANELAKFSRVPYIIVTYAILKDPRSLGIELQRLFTEACKSALEHHLDWKPVVTLYFPCRPKSLFEDKSLANKLYSLLYSLVLKGRNKKAVWARPCPDLISLHERASHHVWLEYTSVCILTTRLLTLDLHFWGEDLITKFDLPITPSITIPDQIYNPRKRDLVSIDFTDNEYEELLITHNNLVQLLYTLDVREIKVVYYRITYEQAIKGLKMRVPETEGFRYTLANTPWILHPPKQPREVVFTPLRYGAPDLRSHSINIDQEVWDQRFTQIAQPPERNRLQVTPSVLYRPLRLSTTALNKYLIILEWVEEMAHHAFEEFTALACADGSGGVACLLARLFVNATIVYNTLSSDTTTTGCVDTHFLEDKERERLMYLHNDSGYNDLTESKTVEYLQSLVCSQGKPFLLLTCDAEATNIETSESDKHLLISVAVLSCAHLEIGGMAIVKRYITTSRFNCSFLSLMRHCFEKIYIVKPEASSETSGECFFVGSNLVRNLPPDFIISHMQEELVTESDQELFRLSMSRLYIRRQSFIHQTSPYCSMDWGTLAYKYPTVNLPTRIVNSDWVQKPQASAYIFPDIPEFWEEEQDLYRFRAFCKENASIEVSTLLSRVRALLQRGRAYKNISNAIRALGVVVCFESFAQEETLIALNNRLSDLRDLLSPLIPEEIQWREGQWEKELDQGVKIALSYIGLLCSRKPHVADED
uniref:RNA-directed RNA polymerase L n=1 Tax=Schistocephalus solidus TaxID=70667 RepID=A0A0X3PYN5_SCHSO